jgi:hypothetical protein
LTLNVTMTGSGSIGHVAADGWSILESCTPAMPGDSRGSMGTATVRAQVKSDSRFVMDNEALLESSAGSVRMRVSEVSVDGLEANLSLVGPAQFLNVDKIVPPLYAQDATATPFGTLGSGTGLIGSFGGMGVDRTDGSVYVGSWGAASAQVKVVKYDQTGAYVLEFGASGTGDGQFDSTYGAGRSAVDSSGNVWVIDRGNARIQKFGPTGTFIAKTGTAGAGDGQFAVAGITGVAVDSSDNVYVTDEGNYRITKFNSSGVYQAKVSTATSVPGALVNLRGIAIDASNLVYVSVPTGNHVLDGEIYVYNSSLVFQRSFKIIPSALDYTFGYSDLDIDEDGDLWATLLLIQDSRAVYQTFVVKLDTTTGAETGRWYAPPGYGGRLGVSVGGTFTQGAYSARMNHVTGDLLLGSFAQADLSPTFPLTSPRVTPIGLLKPHLSSAIQTYMEACDPLLNGWTLDYQGAVDPEVVIPGWSGNVWANLKELFATYGVELVADHDTQTFIVRDIGSATTTITNFGANGVTTHPVNLTGGRVVDVIFQQPRAGGGVVWDAATENVSVSIAAGARQTKILYTVNHPAELAQPVPTDTLPIQPGQYYVTDSTGTAVPAATWLAAGGNITLAVGDSPGTISATIIGPSAAISGYTGPYSFATGNTATSTPALSIVGNGTFCTPVTFIRAESQGQPFNSPFMDTVDRVLSRGHAPSAQAPNVSISFTCPVSELPTMGQAVGTIITHDGSKYRIGETQWGNLAAPVTAERHVTIADIDTRWSGQSIATIDTFWSGYSLGDQAVQPLRT